MTILNNLPSLFVPFLGLVFPAIAITSFFIYIQRKKIL